MLGEYVITESHLQPEILLHLLMCVLMWVNVCVCTGCEPLGEHVGVCVHGL